MTKPLVLVDEKLSLAARLLASDAEVRTFPGRSLSASDPVLGEASGLVVRSITTVDAALLAAAPRLQVVASATVGLEHVDSLAALQRHVEVRHAPGCNAPGVADWVTAAMVADMSARGRKPREMTLGIVGAGHTGSAVAARARRLGMEVRLSDPPRAARDPDFCDHSLDEVLACDVVSLHAPATTSRVSRWPTMGLLNERTLALIPDNALIINAARGALVDESALLAALASGRGLVAAIDTWRGEPRPCAALVAGAWRATPHVAGQTVEGKARGQTRAAEGVAEILGLNPAPVPRGAPRAAEWRRVDLSGAGRSALDALALILSRATGLVEVERALRACVATGAPFDEVRDSHARHDLEAVRYSAEGTLPDGLEELLGAVGIGWGESRGAGIALLLAGLLSAEEGD